MEAIRGFKNRTTDDLLCDLLNKQNTIIKILNNYTTIHSFSICVNNKQWVKSIVYDSRGNYKTTYWYNELGQLVTAPEPNLISDCGCSSNSNDTPVQLNDSFDVLLETVKKYS